MSTFLDRSQRGRAGVSRAVPTGLTATAIVAWIVALRTTDLADVGPLGVVTALPGVYWAAWVLLVLALCVHLFAGPQWRMLLVVQTVAVVAMLHATVPIVEQAPRFATAWLHAGFADYIMRTGETLPQLDARFAWPGFFSMAAMLTTAAGLDSPVSLIRWTPVFLNLAYALLVYAIVAQASDDTRLRWVAVWVFLAGNWVGQDYFSPQGVAVLLFLAVIVILLAAFRGRPEPLALWAPLEPIEMRSQWWARWHIAAVERVRSYVASHDHDDVTGLDLSPMIRLMLLGLVVGMCGVLVVSHQLTPVALTVSVAALVVTRRCRLTLLPALMATLFLAWLSFGAVTYWQGHLSVIFGDVGDVGAAVGENVAGRVGGSDARLAVLAVRLTFTAAICGLAAVGFVRRSTHPRDRSFLLLAVTPFLVLMGNAYGGEALMRAYFYALPFLALYAATMLVPPTATGAIATVHGAGGWLVARRSRSPTGRAGDAVGGTSIVAAAVPYTIARYGNESFEMVTVAERTVFDTFYAQASAGTDVVILAGEVPARYREVEAHRLVSLETTRQLRTTRVDSSDPAARGAAFADAFAEAADTTLRDNPDALVVITRGQDAYGQLTWSLPPAWTSTVVQRLRDTGRFAVTFANADGWILQQTDALAGPTPGHGVQREWTAS